MVLSTCPVMFPPLLIQRTLGETGDSSVTTTHHICLLAGKFEKSFLEQMTQVNWITICNGYCQISQRVQASTMCLKHCHPNLLLHPELTQGHRPELWIRNATSLHSAKHNLLPSSPFSRSLGNRVKKESYNHGIICIDKYFMS